MEQDVSKIRIATAATFYDAITANIMAGKLEAAGIDCSLMDENIVTVNPLYTSAVGGIKLQVREEDLEKAKEILAVYLSENDDETDDSVVCPYCGSTDTIVALGASNVFAATAALFLASLPFYHKKRYRCNTCKKYFKVSSRKEEVKS